MDITDGLGQSLKELGEASDVGFEIDAKSVPVDPLAVEVSKALSLDLDELVFGIGLDLELLVTVPRDRVGDARGCGLTTFGHVRAERGITVDRDGHVTGIPGRGWEHFGGDVREYVSKR
jgi:thiamine-monophosphate kinase